MPLNLKWPKFPPRFSSIFLKDPSSNSASEHSTPVDSIPNQGVGLLTPHDPSTLSLPQDSMPQLSKHPSTNETNRAESLRSSRLAASTSSPVANAQLSESSIRASTGGSETTTSRDPRNRVLPSHSMQTLSQTKLPSESLTQDAPQSQSVLAGAHDFRIRNFKVVYAHNATHVNAVNTERARFDTLPKHPEMSATLAEYIPDSRKPDVEKLCERVSSGTELVLCIHGPAGIGKSMLVGHLSDKFRSEGCLAGSVSLGGFPTGTYGPGAIIKMIAYEIGSIHPQAIPKIVEAMDQCHATSFENHLQKYIVEPLQSLNHPRPFIIIIDAMDEWRDHPAFIKALAHLNSQSCVVKFIITDRLNPCASHLPGIERISVYTYALGPISKEVIKAYFQKHLETVPWVDGRRATPVDVEKLTELSGGLPVWASTVVAVLSHRFGESPPHEILEEIVGSRRHVGSNDGLGELYGNALSRLFHSPEDQRQLRRYLGASLALQEPLPPSSFSTLSGIRSHLTDCVRFALSALQTRSPPPGSEDMIYPATALFHLSFIDLSAFRCHPQLPIYTNTNNTP
ncbi:hypothetical protein EST38_g3057 [Candolleomyces aberdarensis]|uniref:Nephrocystin 3-like N-terminal domain-containing protein n=1 Tax=Candolleomyces aberdarensis TaxID=2316362 RepID=A0A4Q2DRZ6_9AGAR|nr:hypothetical protein EST38_g3057 [Candolleomyces aberdarensis]